MVADSQLLIRSEKGSFMRVLLSIFLLVFSASPNARPSCDFFYVEIGRWLMPIPNGYYLRSADVGDFGLYMTIDSVDCHPGNPEALCKRNKSGFQISYFDEISVRGDARWDKLDDWNGFSRYRAKDSELEDIPFDIIMYIMDGVTFSLIANQDVIDEYQSSLDECAWVMEK